MSVAVVDNAGNRGLQRPAPSSSAASSSNSLKSDGRINSYGSSVDSESVSGNGSTGMGMIARLPSLLKGRSRERRASNNVPASSGFKAGPSYTSEKNINPATQSRNVSSSLSKPALVSTTASSSSSNNLPPPEPMHVPAVASSPTLSSAPAPSSPSTTYAKRIPAPLNNKPSYPPGSTISAGQFIVGDSSPSSIAPSRIPALASSASSRNVSPRIDGHLSPRTEDAPPSTHANTNANAASVSGVTSGLNISKTSPADRNPDHRSQEAMPVPNVQSRQTDMSQPLHISNNNHGQEARQLLPDINTSNINQSNINQSNINQSNINQSNINQSNVNQSGPQIDSPEQQLPISESRRSSALRSPLPTAPISTREGNDASTLSISRSPSSEASAKPFTSPSMSMGRSISASRTSSQVKLPLSGITILEELEAKHLSPSAAASSAHGGSLTEGDSVAVATRIKMVRKLVELRGPRVLDGVDVERIVWLDGTSIQMTIDEELSQARNGSAISNPPSAGASPVPNNPATVSHPHNGAQKQALPPVPLQPVKDKKTGLFDRMAAKLGGQDATNHRRLSSGGLDTGSDNVAASTNLKPSQEQQHQYPANAAANVNALNALNRGPIFGAKISEAPPMAYAVSIIGGQRHQLPILVFSLVEAIFRRGIQTSGIFRMNGTTAAINRLVELYNTYPTYGDDVDLEQETLFTLCDLLKKYLRDLPESVLSQDLWNLFVAGCLVHTGADQEQEHVRKLAAAQVIFRLLPRKNTSLLIYLTAFLFQLPLHPSNRLTIESISVIFGPSMLAPRFPADNMQHTQERTIKRSQEGLKWLLDNWDDSLSQDLLDEEYDCLANPASDREAWMGEDSDGKTQHDNDKVASSEEASAKIQYSQKVPVFQESSNSPAVSMMASPMQPNFSQETSSSSGSLVPEGWGSAISPEVISAQEDHATRQRVLQSNARKSSFNIDPVLSAPNRNDLGISSTSYKSSVSDDLRSTFVDGRNVEMIFKPANGIERQEEPFQTGSRVSEKQGTASQDISSPNTRSLRTIKSGQSMKSITQDSSIHDSPPLREESIHMPGDLPLYSPAAPPETYNPMLSQSTPGQFPTSVSPTNFRSSTEAVRSLPKVDRALPQVPGSPSRDSPTNYSPSQFVDGRAYRSSGNVPIRDRPSHSRDESGYSNSNRNSQDRTRERPSSYARSEPMSDVGSTYLPEEISSDPNAARLFGSLGELFMSEKRKLSEYQAQLKQYELRAAEQEEHIAALHKEVLDRESRTRELENEVEMLRGQTQSYKNDLKATEDRNIEFNDLQNKHRELESVITSMRQQSEKEEEKRSHVEMQHLEESQDFKTELGRLERLVEANKQERDLARTQLDSIRSLLQLAKQ